MKKILSIIITLCLFSCSSKKQFYSMYEYQKENRAEIYNSKGNHNIEFTSEFTGELVFETYVDFKFIEHHRFEIKKGEKYNLELTPNYYYLTFLDEYGNGYHDAGKAYFPKWSWGNKFNDYIETWI